MSGGARRARSKAIAIVVASVAGLAAPVCSGCGPWVALPERAPHAANEERVEVPYPPPPPKVQVIPERPSNQDEMVWIDGEWIWRGRRWEWQVGRWELPPEGAKYAPPEIVFLPDKRIGWLRGAWRAMPAAP